MKKIFLVMLSVVLLGSLFLMLRTGRDFNGDIRIKGGSFIEDIKIQQKKKGVTLWTLTASKAIFTEGEDKAELSDISIKLVKNDVMLHADKGIYNLSDKSFTTDSVVKAASKDYRITADSLDYAVASGNIETGGKITVEGKGFKMEGKGLEANADQKVRILNDVKATFHK